MSKAAKLCLALFAFSLHVLGILKQAPRFADSVDHLDAEEYATTMQSSKNVEESSIRRWARTLAGLRSNEDAALDEGSASGDMGIKVESNL